jgi:hypothetical protein
VTYARIFDAESFSRVIRQGVTQESDRLDFKREPPKDLAVRIAAFANHLGGVIAIGVDEAPRDSGPNVADAFVGVEDVDEQRRGIIQKIGQVCRPTPTVSPSSFVVEGHAKPMLLLNIDPITHGVVGVLENDRWRFPKRVDARTDYMTYEEIVVRTTSTARTAWIKLTALFRDATQGPVRIASGYFINLPKGGGNATYWKHVSNMSAKLVALDENSLELEVQGRRVTIPLSYVDEAWQASTSEPTIALRCRVYYKPGHKPGHGGADIWIEPGVPPDEK